MCPVIIVPVFSGAKKSGAIIIIFNHKSLCVTCIVAIHHPAASTMQSKLVQLSKPGTSRLKQLTHVYVKFYFIQAENHSLIQLLPAFSGILQNFPFN